VLNSLIKKIFLNSNLLSPNFKNRKKKNKKKQKNDAESENYLPTLPGPLPFFTYVLE
jgi:hypothetical protein